MSALLSWFISPGGLLVLATLDSSLLFFLPLANDVVVVNLAAGHSTRFWLYPLIATVGSVLGAGSTYWVGTRIGDDGLEKWISPRRVDRVRRRVKETGAVTLAVPALIPPPFPFTPFVLASGALRVHAATFFAVLAAMRLLRFGAEAWLARIYGRQLLQWMHSPAFQIVVWGLILLAVVGSAWSAYELIRKSRPRRAPAVG